MTPSLLPANSGGAANITIVPQPTDTYKLDFEEGRIRNYVKGLEAMEQFVFKVLQTDRYRHVIYDWNYGIEIDDLFGRPITIVKAKLPGRITDALSADDRVLSVADFVFTEPVQYPKTAVCVQFTVNTIFGPLYHQYERNFE